MTNLINFLVSEEAILVYIIALIVSILYIIFYFIKKTSHDRKKRQNTMELKRLVEDVKDSDLKSKKNILTNKSVSLIKNDEDSFGDAMNATVYMDSISNPIIKDAEVTPSVSYTAVKKNTVVEPVIEVSEVKEAEEIKVEPVEEIKVAEVTPAVKEIAKEREEVVVVEDLLRVVEDSPIMYEEKIEDVPAISEKAVRTIPVVVSDIPRIITPEEEKIVYAKKEVVPDVIEEISNEVTVEEILEPVSEIKYTSIAPKKEEAKEELQKITEQLEKEESKNIELTEFERLQEDTAIISLDELMKKAGELYQQNEEIQYQDEGNEIISIEDLEMRKNQMNVIEIKKKDEKEDVEQLTLDDLYNVKITPVSEEKVINDDKKFRISPVISPVYGLSPKQSSSKVNELELENTANYEKLDEEIRKTNEFIATLKELQKKLD